MFQFGSYPLARETILSMRCTEVHTTTKMYLENAMIVLMVATDEAFGH